MRMRDMRRESRETPCIRGIRDDAPRRTTALTAPSAASPVGSSARHRGTSRRAARALAMMSAIDRRRQGACARVIVCAISPAECGRTEINRTTPSRETKRRLPSAESIRAVRRVCWTCAFHVSDDQNGPLSSPWSLVAQHADETAVIRDPCSVLGVTSREAEGRPRTRVVAVVALRRSGHGCIWRCPRTGAV